ncbi:MAG TPA: YciI family protein [Polyangiaceae bacterium]|nr:YciI family protein [Polyangiaceae bacterium]
MRYLVLIGHDEKGGLKMSEEQHRELFQAYQKYEQDLKQAGVLLGGEPLKPSAGAVRISSEGGKRKLLDGPFSESKELIGGYFVLDVKSRDEAVEWASRCPAAQLPGGWSYVEVREIQEIPR